MKAVVKRFNKAAESEYARAGEYSTETCKVPAGVLDKNVYPWAQYDMVERLRELQLSVHLDDGKIVVEEEHVICKKGEELSPRQTQLLKLFDHKLVQFKVTLVSHWTDGKYKKMK